jgi:hypothetical protein
MRYELGISRSTVVATARFGRPVGICLAALLLSLFTGSEPSLGSESSPPGKLPRMILECDINPGAPYFCATWIWNDDHYDATWSNGSIGQMTVVDAHPNSIVINRADHTGAAAGLTAQYKGKWDGKQITDGTVPWSWRGSAGNSTWIAEAVTTPVACIDTGSIEDVYTAPLTAWVFAADQNVDGRILPVKEPTVDLLIGENPAAPIQPFHSKRDDNCWRARVVDFRTQKFETHITAAVFADGSTFGDRKQIDAIMATRGQVVREYTEVANRLCGFAEQPGITRDQIRESLQQMHQRGNGQARGFFGLALKPNETLASRINGALKVVRDTRALLLAPVRDEQGRLYIEPPQDSCEAK